jgi:fucose 4-O-acetylase-like acetyltransferase
MGNRIIYLDVVKCWAIFLVLWGHSLSHFSSMLAYNNWLYEWIYSFHMPLFMLISGYFSSHSMSKQFNTFIKDKAKLLILPVVSWCLISCIYLYFTKQDLVEIKSELIGSSWFLRTLFACFVMVFLLKKMHYTEGLICVLSCILLFILPYASFLQINWLFVFFWIGFFMHKYSDLLDKNRALLTIASIIISVVLYFIKVRYGIPDYIIINVTSLSHNLVFLICRFLLSFSECFAVIGLIYYICQWFHDSSVIQVVAKCGRYTLGIYVMQSLFLERIMPVFVHYSTTNTLLYNFVLTPLTAMASMILFIIMIRILSRNKYINLLLFGGQYLAKR